MRYDKGRKEQTRKRIVDVASARFRARGIEATGVAGLMADAGLTHGGFYAHFRSKDDLVRAAIAEAHARSRRARWNCGHTPAPRRCPHGRGASCSGGVAVVRVVQMAFMEVVDVVVVLQGGVSAVRAVDVVVLRMGFAVARQGRPPLPDGGRSRRRSTAGTIRRFAVRSI